MPSLNQRRAVVSELRREAPLCVLYVPHKPWSAQLADVTLERRVAVSFPRTYLEQRLSSQGGAPRRVCGRVARL